MRRQLMYVLTAVCAAGLLLGGCGSQKGGSEESTRQTSGSQKPEKEGTEAAEGSTTGEKESEKEEFLQPQVAESGYSIVGTETDPELTYGVKVTNPNRSDTITDASLVISGKAADGSMLFTTRQALGRIRPGETIGWADSMIDCNKGVPASVDFAVTASEYYAEKREEDQGQKSAKDENQNPDVKPLFTIESTAERQDNLGYVCVIGEITYLGEAKQQTAGVSVILRNNGAIVGGYSGFAENLIPGTKRAFEADSLTRAEELPQHTSYEVTAIPW